MLESALHLFRIESLSNEGYTSVNSCVVVSTRLASLMKSLPRQREADRDGDSVQIGDPSENHSVDEVSGHSLPPFPSPSHHNTPLPLTLRTSLRSVRGPGSRGVMGGRRTMPRCNRRAGSVCLIQRNKDHYSDRETKKKTCSPSFFMNEGLSSSNQSNVLCSSFGGLSM